ncbi:MAG TPA: lysine--tRNA ligase [bacterium]|nr:lysine--tRNA ligase [bacterium]HPQ19374.1 lysine--tRNA ligase [bacterium]
MSEKEEFEVEQLKYNEYIEQRIKKLEELKKLGINTYPNKFERTETTKTIKENYEENKEVSIAGRIIAVRKMGKSAFIHIKDEFDKIQLYIRVNELGKDNFENFFKYIDIGDFIGVKGNLFVTHTGEKSIFVKEYVLLTKSLRPLPEKWHGLKDTEKRYRQRYVDLIVNEEVKETFKLRTKIIEKIREYLNKHDFIEVETPMMQQLAGGAIAKPFITYHNTLDMNLYLRIAPELYLKRLVVGGFEKVYELNRNFRNEGISTWHNPEFTMLEIYQAYADYNDMMELCENIIIYAVNEILKNDKIVIDDNEIKFTKPFKRIKLFDIIKEYTNFDIENITEKEIYNFLESKEIKVEPNLNKYELLNEIFENFIEEKLIQPTFIIDYPKVISPLAKSKINEPEIVERFELFINGKEIGNAYSELNDPIEQKKRFYEQAEKKIKIEKDKTIDELIDFDYIRALEYGMPPTGGLGIGIDRLVMLLTKNKSIRDVILFPLLKKEN